MVQVLQQPGWSPEVAQQVATSQLGSPTAEYKVGYSKLVIGGMVSGFAIAVVFVVIAILAFTSDPTNVDTTTLSIFVLFIALGLLGGVYFLLYPVIYRSWRVYICSQGFVSSRWNKVTVLRWDMIEAMWQNVMTSYQYGIKVYTQHKYTVNGKDGTKVVFKDNYLKVEELANEIIAGMMEVKMPEAIAAYKSGATVEFGPLSVSRMGLGNGKNVLPWHELKQVGLNRGYVNVEKQGKLLNWASILAGKVPNLLVFLALVDYAQGNL